MTSEDLRVLSSLYSSSVCTEEYAFPSSHDHLIAKQDSSFPETNKVLTNENHQLNENDSFISGEEVDCCIVLNSVDQFTQEVLSSRWVPKIFLCGVDIVSISLNHSQNPKKYVGYPKNAVFQFTGYCGIADQERITRDIKHAAFIGGTTLRIYSSHKRNNEMYVFLFSVLFFYLDSCSMTQFYLLPYHYF